MNNRIAYGRAAQAPRPSFTPKFQKGDIVVLNRDAKRYVFTFPAGMAGRISWCGITKTNEYRAVLDLVYPNATLGPEVWITPDAADIADPATADFLCDVFAGRITPETIAACEEIEEEVTEPEPVAVAATPRRTAATRTIQMTVGPAEPAFIPPADAVRTPPRKSTGLPLITPIAAALPDPVDELDDLLSNWK